MTTNYKFIFITFFLGLLQGCAHLQSPNLETTPAQAPSLQDLQRKNYFSDLNPEVGFEVLSLKDPQRWDGEEIQFWREIETLLPLSNVQVSRVTEKKVDRKQKSFRGSFVIKEKTNNPECKIGFVKQEGKVSIRFLGEIQMLKSGFVKKENCFFEVSYQSELPVPWKAKFHSGTIQIQDWNAPIELAEVKQADIHFSNIDSLNLECGHCILTGEDAKGPIVYKLESGNVGIEGLEGSVQGETYGDIVLKWKKLLPKSKIKIQSLGGDVAMGFPPSVYLKPQVQLARGEVYTDLRKTGLVAAEVHIDAKVGTVKFFKIRE